jgi:RimJ/RimL family protein N-acetyltransferase
MDDAAVRHYPDAAAYRRIVEPLLLEREAANCIQLGVLSSLAGGAHRDAFLATVERDGVPLLAAMRVPPHDLTLSQARDVAAVDPLVERLLAAERGATFEPEAAQEALGRVAGVRGDPETTDAFAAAWAAANGGEVETVARLNVYEARDAHAADVPGHADRATDADHDLLARWIHAFYTEAVPHEPQHAEAAVTRWLSGDGRTLWIWRTDDGPVTLVGLGHPTPHGVRIRAVYTPPEHRGRGYAQAAVAAVTRHLLEQGRRPFVFADEADAGANHVYAGVGFEVVGTSHHLRFATGLRQG